MKTENKELLGFTVPCVGIVETIAEATAAGGSEAEVVKVYNANTLAHSHYTVLRKAMTKKLVELTGIPMKTVKNENGKEVIDETEAEYRARLDTDLGEDAVQAYEKDLQKVCEGIPVDYTPGVRGAGGSAKPAQKWLDYYDQLKTENKLDSFCQKHGIDQALDEDNLKIVVAQKVKEVVTAKMQAAAKEALAI